MTRNQNGEPRKRAPTHEDFISSAVQKAVIKETSQHPLTIIPLALTGLGVLWMGLNGLDMNTFIATIGTGALACTTWIINFFFRDEYFANEYVRNMRAQRAMYKRVEFNDITNQCDELEFTEGKNVADGLQKAFEILENQLNDARHQPGVNMTAERFLMLAEDARDEGVSILQQSLHLRNAVSQINVQNMRKEIVQWTREYDDLLRSAIDEVQKNRIERLKRQIQSHEEIITMAESKNAKIEQLLTQCEELEGALKRASLECAELVQQSDVVVFASGTVASQLDIAVRSARRVEERLHTTNQPTDEDALYAKAGNRLHQGE